MSTRPREGGNTAGLPHHDTRRVPRQSPMDERGEAKGGRGRVLVVEDEYLVALQAEAVLTEEGFEVVGIAVSAQEAVQLAAREAPDLIIMDIRLAGPGDGVDAAVEIFRESGIRCIFATAHDDAETRTRAAAARPLGWLRKPYMMGDLIRITRAAIAKARRGT